jgi:ankyrin repeat protein
MNSSIKSPVSEAKIFLTILLMMVIVNPLPAPTILAGHRALKQGRGQNQSEAPVKIKLLDASTGRLIANQAACVRTDDHSVAIKFAVETWFGKSDKSGVVTIPAQIFQRPYSHIKDFSLRVYIGAGDFEIWFEIPQKAPKPLAVKLPRKPRIRIQIFDAETGEPIARTPVYVNSSDGRGCFEPPCPLNRKKWRGQSDGAGLFALPYDLIQDDTSIQAGNYRGRIPVSGQSPEVTCLELSRHPSLPTIRVTPLMKAAREANVQGVTDLLAQGADVNAKDVEGSTALFYANSGIHSLDAIIEASIGANPLDPFKEPFIEMEKIRQLLIGQGADVNAANLRGETPLMCAAASLYPPAVFTLLDSGANADAVDANGNTALLRALLPIANTPSIRTSRKLSENDKYWRIHVARDLIGAKLLPIVKALIAKGVNVKVKNKKGETALMLANRIAEHFGQTSPTTLLQQTGATAGPTSTAR